jgi:voltage-gated potassium channel
VAARSPARPRIVVLTPPFLPATLQAARVFRLLRLLRLMKAATLTRRLRSTEGVRDAARARAADRACRWRRVRGREKSQHLSAWDGVWWALTTVTTVGYGTPEVTTDAGRVIAIVVMLVGIGFVAVLTGAIAQRFVAPAEERVETSEAEVHAEVDAIAARLERLEGRPRGAPIATRPGGRPCWAAAPHSLRSM